MRGKNLVGQGGDKFVAAGGEVGGDAAFGLGEDGEDQQAAVGERLFPVRGDAFRQAPGGTDDDGWLAAQEDAKTLLLDRGMEAADDAVTAAAPLGGPVVGAEDDAAGAPGGAEQGRHGLREQLQVTESGQLWRGVGAQTLAQAGRITGIVTRDYLWLRVHGEPASGGPGEPQPRMAIIMD